MIKYLFLFVICFFGFVMLRPHPKMYKGRKTTLIAQWLLASISGMGAFINLFSFLNLDNKQIILNSAVTVIVMIIISIINALIINKRGVESESKN